MSRYRTKGLHSRQVVSEDDKARIVAELKQWKADGGLERAVKPSGNKIKIQVLSIIGRS